MFMHSSNRPTRAIALRGRWARVGVSPTGYSSPDVQSALLKWRMTIVSLASTGPYSLELSLRAAESFAPAGSSPPHETPEVLRSAVRLDGEAAILEVRQVNDEPARLEAEVRTLGSGPRGRPGPPPDTVP